VRNRKRLKRKTLEEIERVFIGEALRKREDDNKEEENPREWRGSIRGHFDAEF
jgi:hypothetical protein